MKYVKICPRCGRKNDEFSDACAADGEFLGMVPATPFREDAPPDICSDESPESFSEPVSVPQTLYLEEKATGLTHEIRDGYVVGQTHPTNDAQVQLENIEGLKYVHRRHCQFNVRDGQWSVTSIDHGVNTNPTFVNQQRLSPGQTASLKNGDKVTLSTVVFNVRMIGVE